MKILSVVGARPQFVKLAPIAEALSARGHQHVIIHTGQHYDRNMSESFFDDLEIREPDLNLGVGSSSHGVQTGAILAAMDQIILDHQPDWVLVYGDTNSTVGAALSAAKLNVPLAHLEAGLRSFNRQMPEETNRVLTDHAADLLLAPTSVAMKHLAREGLASRAILVGDVMTDVCLRIAERVKDFPPELPVPDKPFVLATIHRAENTDNPKRLESIVRCLSALSKPVLLTAHPRLVAKAMQYGITLGGGSLTVVDPLNYPSMVSATLRACAVVTDSGGLQKEAFLLRTPCVTVRPETEWVETVSLGWNVLVEDLTELEACVGRPTPSATDDMPYGDGSAAAAVVSALETT